MAKLHRATSVEKMQYQRTNPVHRLYGWVVVQGQRLPVEYLGEGRGEPNYEALAPEGYHFLMNGVHSLLGTTQKDLLDRLSYERFEACGEGC